MALGERHLKQFAKKSCRKNLTAILELLFIVSNESNSEKIILAKCLSVTPFGIKSILLASGSSVYPELRPWPSGVVELFELPLAAKLHVSFHAT